MALLFFVTGVAKCWLPRTPKMTKPDTPFFYLKAFGADFSHHSQTNQKSGNFLEMSFWSLGQRVNVGGNIIKPDALLPNDIITSVKDKDVREAAKL
ncbi:unnamed protein product [Prunus armeniaca]